jgi:hypothetical protein
MARHNPEVGEEDGRGEERGNAAREPLGHEEGPEDMLLSKLVEPEPVRLELRRQPREQGHDRQHAE